MTIRYSCGCGKAFDLAEQFAGKTVRCPNCQTVGTVPTAAPPQLGSLGMPPLQHSPLSATPAVPMPPPPAASSVQPQFPSTSSAPHATTPFLELPNPYGGNAPRPNTTGGLGLPPPNSVWNAPSPLTGPGGIPQGEPAAYAKSPGMSTTAKVLLGLGLGSVFLGAICCGGIAMIIKSVDIPQVNLPMPMPPVPDEPNGMPGRAFGFAPLPEAEIRAFGDLEAEIADLPEGVAAAIFEEKAQEVETQLRDFPLAKAYLLTSIKLGGAHRVDMARLFALEKNHHAAMAWLEEAMEYEGISDVSDLEADTDLRNSLNVGVNRDTIAARNQAWHNYYASHPVYKEELVVPAEYDPTTPIPVVVCLHGYGDNPRDFNIARFYQELANDKQIAFLIVSGTVTFGPNSFKWSPSRTLDANRIDQAFKNVSDRLTPAPGKVVTLGFSHGAMVATHVALKNPSMYAGGIVLSPGGPVEDESLPQGGAVPANETQRFVMLANAGEFPGNVAMTRHAESLAKNVFKCQTMLRIKEGENMHSFPSDYLEELGTWIDFALSGRTEQ